MVDTVDDAQRGRLDKLLWRRAVGEASTAEPVEWAESALLAGLDSPHLRILAGLSQPFHWSEVEHCFERALADFEIVEPEPAEAKRRRVREIAEKIVSGEVSPTRGCCEMRELVETLGYHDDFGDWFYLQEGQEPRNGSKLAPRELNAAIMRQARLLLTTLPDLGCIQPDAAEVGRRESRCSFTAEVHGYRADLPDMSPHG